MVDHGPDTKLTEKRFSMDARHKKYLLSIVVVLSMTGALTDQSLAAEKTTFVGTVSDGYQIIPDDGQPYEVEDTEKGNELVTRHIGRKVEVTGQVKEETDYNSIMVESFRLLEDE